MRQVAEVVVAAAAPLAILKVGAADRPQPRVVAVLLQQGGASGEEMSMHHESSSRMIPSSSCSKNQLIALLTPSR